MSPSDLIPPNEQSGPVDSNGDAADTGAADIAAAAQADPTEAREAAEAGGTVAEGAAEAIKDHTYGASDITVLEGLEAVRKRPGMYIGSTGERGLQKLVDEVVDNAVDEAMAGYCDRIVVTLRDDNSVRVDDNGRGIPVGLHPVEKIPAVTLVLTVLHAGGKFGGGGYKVSGGLHGVGVSVVNALSSRLIVEVYQDGTCYTQTFELGVPVTDLLTTPDPQNRRGTSITFWASPDIFETTYYNHDTISTRLREMAFLNKGLEIVLRDQRPVREADIVADTPEQNPESSAERAEVMAEEVYKYDNGLLDYVDYLSARKEPVSPSISLESHNPDQSLALEIAMQWNTSFSESVHTFANTINTHEGGTHEEGFRAALTSTVNSFAEEKEMIKKREDRLTGDDVREGLTAIVSVKIAEPQFEGQTKTKLGNTEVKSFVQKAVNDKLGAWFAAHPSEGKVIVRRAMDAASARIAARKARDLARDRKGLLGSGGLPGKLSDCSSREPSECEVFIVEGDSAGGSAKYGRDPRTQAILPIRGKILNVEKARIDKVLQNQEIQALISAFGTGIHEDFDIEKLRYHKIILMADADVDGAHIRTLLLTFLFRFMKPLIEAGHVFLAQPPLFRIRWLSPHPHELAYTDAERDGLLRIGREEGKRLPKDGAIQRYKGLGEMNPEELKETTMDPDGRVLLQVSLEDAAQADEMFSILMGEDVEQRRHFIQHNAKDVRFLDI